MMTDTEFLFFFFFINDNVTRKSQCMFSLYTHNTTFSLLIMFFLFSLAVSFLLAKLYVMRVKKSDHDMTQRWHFIQRHLTVYVGTNAVGQISQFDFLVFNAFISLCSGWGFVCFVNRKLMCLWNWEWVLKKRLDSWFSVV